MEAKDELICSTNFRHLPLVDAIDLVHILFYTLEALLALHRRNIKMMTHTVSCPRCGFEVVLSTKGRTVTAVDFMLQNAVCIYPDLMTEIACPHLQEEMARPKRGSNLARRPA